MWFNAWKIDLFSNNGWPVNLATSDNSSTTGRTQFRQKLEQEHVRTLLSEKSEVDNHFEHVLRTLTRDETDDPKIMVQAFNPPHFSCTCDRDKMGAVMKSLPHTERMELVQKGEEVKVNCQFCNTKYVLSIDDCVNIWNDKPF